MKLLGKISVESREALAALWTSADFQELVRLMKARYHRLGEACLREPTIEGWRSIQAEALAIKRLLNAVKEAADEQEQAEKSKN